MGKPAWFHFVLVPGLTDAEENLRGLARHMASFSNVEWVELLPFHQMGMHKWQGPCPRRNPRRDRAGYRAKAWQIFEAAGLPVHA